MLAQLVGDTRRRWTQIARAAHDLGSTTAVIGDVTEGLRVQSITGGVCPIVGGTVTALATACPGVRGQG